MQSPRPAEKKDEQEDEKESDTSVPHPNAYLDSDPARPTARTADKYIATHQLSKYVHDLYEAYSEICMHVQKL